ncbi:MAG: TIGR01459 family HAD-type hydrolase [Pseudomonadota bacterium]
MPDTGPVSQPARIVGLSGIIAEVDAILCDVWGVLHNGVAAFPEAVDALKHARASDVPVILITNAPRPADPVIQQLQDLGVSADAFDKVVTSGDVTRTLIAEHIPGPVFHLGPERDRPLFEGLEVAFADLADAKVIVATGLFDDETEAAEDYRPMLEEGVGRGLGMICANPDLVVDRGGRLVPCAGALADLYAEIGGVVSIAGKPHAPIYDRAFDLLSALMSRLPERARVLVVGDGVRTDLAGAVAQDLPCLFVTDGIHAGDGSADALNTLFRRAKLWPAYVLDALRW